MNPFANLGRGGLSTVGMIAIAFVIFLLVAAILIFFVWFVHIKKQFRLSLHIFKLIGNTPTRVAIYKAREVNFGMAGDRLWRVAPPGFMMPFKVVKWLPVGKLQTAANEFWYWIREDGEWINFTPTNIDKISKEIGVTFVQEDMRLQRLATEKLLEQRLLKKTFWEKYGNMIATILFFLVIVVCIVIIFHQWSKLIDATTQLMGTARQLLEESCKSGGGSLVPTN